MVLDGLEKLLASPQLSPAACCMSKAGAKKAVAKVAFILAMLTNGIVLNEGELLSTSVCQHTGRELNERLFAIRLTESKEQREKIYFKVQR